MSRKLDQSKKAKEEFNSELLDILKTDRLTTYDELIETLHLSKRKIRKKLSDLSMYYAVISLSSDKGHRLAKNIEKIDNIEELEEEEKQVIKMINEINSRIKILKGKLKPLIAWKKVAEKTKIND